MKLELIKIINSPLDSVRQAIWVSEKRKSFLLMDMFKVAEVLFEKNAIIEILSETKNKDEAYRIKKPYEERFIPEIYNEIQEIGKNGFKYLSQNDYDRLTGLNAGSDSFFDLTNVFGVHGYELPVQTRKNLILRFLKKAINVLDPLAENLDTKYSIPFKNKDVTAICSFNCQNSIVFGTNTGKIYFQKLSEQKSKPSKVDDCKNVCYDIVVDSNDKFVYVCGMGYFKVYQIDGEKFTLVSEVKTSARSIELHHELAVVNKGMHGMELYKFSELGIEKLDDLEVGFPIDLMRLNKANSTILVSSKPVGKLGLIKIIAA